MPPIVVMGVSGCGKSRVGRDLAARLGVTFLEGDVLHPPENVARMAAGIPLTDADRQGWLEAIAGALAQAAGCGEGIVVSCSALRRPYRDLLRAAAPATRFVHLTGSRALLIDRMAAREGHFMPISLLDSQLATLEPPGADEQPIVQNIEQSPAAILDATVEALGIIK
nr:gluconokinase [Elstera litoralis]